MRPAWIGGEIHSHEIPLILMPFSKTYGPRPIECRGMAVPKLCRLPWTPVSTAALQKQDSPKDVSPLPPHHCYPHSNFHSSTRTEDWLLSCCVTLPSILIALSACPLVLAPQLPDLAPTLSRILRPATASHHLTGRRYRLVTVLSTFKSCTRSLALRQMG